jgi:glucose-1-phosphate cytidylyltransferase
LNEPFLLTYGDGVSDIDIPALLAAHRQHGKIATVTSVRPRGRYGVLTLDEHNWVRSFQEKPADSAWINGGFFAMQPQIFDYLKGGDDNLVLEEALDSVAHDGELFAYKHTGFWRAMDTLKDKRELTDLWMTGHAPWAKWLEESKH